MLLFPKRLSVFPDAEVTRITVAGIQQVGFLASEVTGLVQVRLTGQLSVGSSIYVTAQSFRLHNLYARADIYCLLHVLFSYVYLTTYFLPFMIYTPLGRPWKLPSRFTSIPPAL